jgi:hypothetical protein
MSEREKRNRAMSRAQHNPDNHYDMIKNAARHWLIKKVPEGETVVAGQLFKAVIDRNPNLQPREKRVMGPVMRALSVEKLIAPVGVSNRMRAHRGMAREWKRLRA